MVSIVICDDDKSFAQTLSETVSQIITKAKVAHEVIVFNSGAALLDACRRGQNCDVLLLDIELGDMNGKELTSRIKALGLQFKLIFISGHEHEVFDTFRLKADSFIPKSKLAALAEPELLRIVGEAEEERRFRIPFYAYDAKGMKTELFLHPSQILYFTSDSVSKCIVLHTMTATYNLIGRKSSLETLEAELAEEGFFRIHRTALINLLNVKNFDFGRDTVIMENGSILPLSRGKKNRFKALYLRTSQR